MFVRDGEDLAEGSASLVGGESVNFLVRFKGDNSIRWSAGERLHHLFEDRCDQFHRLGQINHTAVEGNDAVLTYGDLDRRANQLARYLIKFGVGPGKVIGLLFDKSVFSYVSLLAVLKINAAYVPLDPGFPPDRISYIADDAGIRAILTLSAYGNVLQDLGKPLIFLDRAKKQIDAESDARLGADEVSPPVSELCYIIYTSGSTGRPKGVPIEHASICHFVRAAAEVYGYRSADRVYQGLTIAFDFSVEEIWVPLMAGATLVPNQTGISLVGGDLWSFLADNKVSALCCVPTLLATIEDDLPDLRLLIVSGEACPQDLVKRWHSPTRIVLNAYGPTEATVTATVARLKPDEPVTIGTPLPNYSIVILSPVENRALPKGQIGEIGIAGVGLSKGYLGREDLTKTVFIDDFLGIPDNPSNRIYRSGDLGHVNEHDQVEYHGRIDTQVKIRGYRIELAEIESIIMGLPEVGQAVVDTFEPEPGATELVAYYSLVDQSRPLPPEEVCLALSSLLPSYMVPAFYECLPSIPMLPSAKADRKALPKPSGQRFRRTRGEYVAPNGPLETDLAGILADLLKVEQVSATDHFFDDLGANSLLMAQFSTRIRKQLNITGCSIRDMYSHPSVRQLSDVLASTLKRAVPLRRNKPSHMATDFDYYGCAALQLLVVFASLYAASNVLTEGTAWMLGARGSLDLFARAMLFAVVVFVISVGAPVALKWLLIGKWKEEEFPVWSLKYFRFWLVKSMTRLNPIVLFAGSPLYIAYLKALGAKVSWNSVIFSTTVPVCTDLVSIGDGAIIRKNALFSTYRAESNRIKTGRVTIGRETSVGEATVLDINTVMEDGSQLGHTSSLQMGERLAAGRRYHGSPAQETETNYDLLERGTLSLRRKVAFSLLQLGSLIFAAATLLFLILWSVTYSHTAEGHAAENIILSLLPEQVSTLSLIHWILLLTTLFFFGALLSGLAFMFVVPRLLNLFLTPDKTYTLYGIHHIIYGMVSAMSNSRLYNEMFGDSSLIVHYLRALGYRFRGGIVQTGTNFGQEQKHDIPFLCEFGRGTVVSDGLTMINADVSTSSFRLSKVSLGADNFLGNRILYPSQGKIGDNCLLATKVMVPIDGRTRENTGLLGSPCFEIPRSTRRDKKFVNYSNAAVKKERIKKKNRSNGLTLFYYLLAGLVLLNILAKISFFMFVEMRLWEAHWIAAFLVCSMVGSLTYLVVVDRASLGFGRLKPRYCSIYDDYFWRHERHWKLTSPHAYDVLNGTPFKNLAWRALGVRVGRKLFDDGCSIPEKTLTTIGDYCTLNGGSILQCHSLEDGTFKSDHIVIGNNCTVGVAAFVHYGVEMEDDAIVETDSFLMKGERPAAASCWRGNPAQEAQVAALEPAGGPIPAMERPVIGDPRAPGNDEAERTPAAIGWC